MNAVSVDNLYSIRACEVKKEKMYLLAISFLSNLYSSSVYILFSSCIIIYSGISFGLNDGQL